MRRAMKLSCLPKIKGTHDTNFSALAVSLSGQVNLPTRTRAADRPSIPVVIWVVSITAVALVVRVAMALRSGLWRDEALFMFIAQSPSWGAMVDFLRLHESHPPLFYAVMRTWLSLMGGTDAVALALPVAFGVALVPAIYLVGASLFSRRAGLIAAGFAALSPALTEYSGQVRPYSLLPLLTLASIYFLIRGLDLGGRRAWGGYAVSTLALVYTHNWGWLVLVGEWTAVSVALLTAVKRGRGRVLREWLSVQGIIAVAYLPWAPWLIYQTRHAGHAPSLLDLRSHPVSAIAISAHALVQSTLLAYPALDTPLDYPVVKRLFLALPVILLAADQLLRARESQEGGGGLTTHEGENDKIAAVRLALICMFVASLTAWIGALVVSPYSDLMIQGCLVMLAPPLLLAMTWWLERPRQGTMLWLTRASIVALLATYCSSLYDLTRMARSNARELAVAVAARTEPSDLLIVIPEWLASSFNRYYEPTVEQIDYPLFGREGAVDYAGILNRLADPTALVRLQDRIAGARGAGRRVWLVVERSAVQQSSPEMIERLLKKPGMSGLEVARVSQIRSSVEAIYGPADASVFAQTLPPQYEDLVALMFTPADSRR